MANRDVIVAAQGSCFGQQPAAIQIELAADVIMPLGSGVRTSR